MGSWLGQAQCGFATSELRRNAVEEVKGDEVEP
jgi:hypothetical protein